MQKTILQITFIGFIILSGGCTKNDNTINSITNNQQNNYGQIYTTGSSIANSNGDSLNTGNSTNNTTGNLNIKTINDFPFFNEDENNIKGVGLSFTGELLSGTNKINLDFFNKNISKTFAITGFNYKNNTYQINLRLDFNNILLGKNEYIISFYDKQNNPLGRRKKIVYLKYSEIKLGNKSILTYNTGYNHVGNLFHIINSEYGDENESLLLENGKYTILPNFFSYSKETNSILIYKETNQKDIYDIYEDGKILLKGIYCAYLEILNLPDYYDKKNGYIYINNSQGEMNKMDYNYIRYNLKDQTKRSFLNITNGIGYVENKYIFNGYKVYDENSNYNKSQNTILVNYISNTDKKYFSTFSITKNNYRQNYIYNSDNNIDLGFDFGVDSDKQISTMEIFTKNLNKFVAKDVYGIKLGKLVFNLNFKTLVDKQYKMPALGLDGKNNNFDYSILLKKTNNEYNLSFEKIKEIDENEMSIHSSKKLDKIGITSCSLKETIINSTNGIYNFKISEKIKNKCNNSYKINAYYKDGSIETGEYFIIFN